MQISAQLDQLHPVCRLDDKWHHIAATWSWEDGRTQLYFDGQQHKPYFKREGFSSELKSPEEGGVDDHMAAQTTRSDLGNLLMAFISQFNSFYFALIGCLAKDGAKKLI